MSTLEQNKAMTLRHVTELWNEGRFTVADEIIAPNYVFHNPPPGMPHNLEGLKQAAVMYRAAFPDLAYTVHDLIAEGDQAVTRWTATGTHLGPMMGIPATGKALNVTGITIERVVDGKIVESWVEFNFLTVLQQLGVAPAMGA